MMTFFDDHFPSEVTAFFSSRTEDFFLTQSCHGLADRQAHALNEQLGCSFEKIFNIRQVHGTAIVVLTRDHDLSAVPIPEADALITKEEDLPLCIRTADCLPVFFFDPQTRAVALAHAGRKGTQRGIAGRVVSRLQAEFGTRPQDLMIGFGPCIRPCCYEVGEDVAESFSCGVIKRREKYYLDLVKENTRQLCEEGVEASRMFDSNVCTCCSENCFSYRREGQSAGRHLSVMMLNSSKDR